MGERRLVAMIPTKGKTKAQVEAEALQAIRKFLDARPTPPPRDAL